MCERTSPLRNFIILSQITFLSLSLFSGLWCKVLSMLHSTSSCTCTMAVRCFPLLGAPPADSYSHDSHNSSSSQATGNHSLTKLKTSHPIQLSQSFSRRSISHRRCPRVGDAGGNTTLTMATVPGHRVSQNRNQWCTVLYARNDWHVLTIFMASSKALHLARRLLHY